MSLIKKALAFSFIGKYLSMLIQFASVMVISRLLVPAEIGLYSIAAGSIVIGQVLRDFGLSLYLVQEKSLTLQKIRTCFSISLSICWLISLIYWMGAAPIADFFDQPEMIGVIQTLALSFIIIPFGTFNLSLIKREMRFDIIMWIELFSAVVGVSVTIALALTDYGVMSLAYGSVAGTLSTVVATFPTSKATYYRLSFSGLKQITKFTSFVSLSNIFTQLNELLPEAAIGKRYSMADTAYFSKAFATVNLFSMLVLSFVTPVIQPFIAKLNREEQNLDKPVYAVTNYILALLWPFSILLLLFPTQILLVLYGDQWHASAHFVQIFALILVVEGLLIMSDQLLNSIGEVRFVFTYSALTLVARVLAIVLLIDLGIELLAWSFLVIAFLRLAYMWPKYRKAFNLKFENMLRVYWQNLKICALVSMFGLISQYSVAGTFSAIIELLICGTTMFCAWVLAIVMFNHPFKQQLISLRQILG